MSYTDGTTNLDQKLIDLQKQQLEDWFIRLYGGLPSSLSWAIALESVADKIRRSCAEQGRSAETR